MAEPSSKIQYLMDEPVSMLDWGMIWIDESLKGTLAEYRTSTITYYDWNENRIIISLSELGSTIGVTSKEKAKEKCRTIVSSIRTFLGINEKDGKPYSEKSNLYSYFSHSGFQRSQPEGLYEELDNITVIRIMIFIEGVGEPVKCEAPLLGNKIMFQE
jgi:hypothetical protein